LQKVTATIDLSNIDKSQKRDVILTIQNYSTLKKVQLVSSYIRDKENHYEQLMHKGQPVTANFPITESVTCFSYMPIMCNGPVHIAFELEAVGEKLEGSIDVIPSVPEIDSSVCTQPGLPNLAGKVLLKDDTYKGDFWNKRFSMSSFKQSSGKGSGSGLSLDITNLTIHNKNQEDVTTDFDISVEGSTDKKSLCTEYNPETGSMHTTLLIRPCGTNLSPGTYTLRGMLTFPTEVLLLYNEAIRSLLQSKKNYFCIDFELK